MVLLGERCGGSKKSSKMVSLSARYPLQRPNVFVPNGTHWRIQGGAPAPPPPPTGSISFVFAHVFAKKCTCWRLAPPPPPPPPTGNPGSAIGTHCRDNCEGVHYINYLKVSACCNQFGVSISILGITKHLKFICK